MRTDKLLALGWSRRNIALPPRPPRRRRRPRHRLAPCSSDPSASSVCCVPRSGRCKFHLRPVPEVISIVEAGSRDRASVPVARDAGWRILWAAILSLATLLAIGVAHFSAGAWLPPLTAAFSKLVCLLLVFQLHKVGDVKEGVALQPNRRRMPTAHAGKNPRDASVINRNPPACTRFRVRSRFPRADRLLELQAASHAACWKYKSLFAIVLFSAPADSACWGLRQGGLENGRGRGCVGNVQRG